MRVETFIERSILECYKLNLMNRPDFLVNSTVRALLIDSARFGKPIAYGGVMSRIGLDHGEIGDRMTFSNILEAISRYEHSRNGRPMLSAMIMYQGLKDIGDKFYWLANQLGYGPQKKLKDEAFDVIMQQRCYQFWSNELYYQQFKDDLPGASARASQWLIPVPPPEGQSTPPKSSFTFSGIEVD
jgi:hypothetical protein